MNDEGHHEILGIVLLRQHHEDSGLFVAELLGIDCGIEAKDLFHLRVQKGIQPGQHGGEDRCQSLICGVECSTRKPLCLMVFWQLFQQELEGVFIFVMSFALCRGQKFLHQFEHADDVPLLDGISFLILCGQVFGDYQEHGCEQTFSRVIEKLVLSIAGI